MTVPPEASDARSAMLEGEWARVAFLVAQGEATRGGIALDAEDADAFATLCTHVEGARSTGAWAGLSKIAPAPALEEITPLDLDILALALAPLARPALAPRMHALQPEAGGPWPALPLVQELLMLLGGEEMAALFARLAPDAPLIAGGLLQVTGDAPAEILRPAPMLARVLLGRDASFAPPEGATLSRKAGTWEDLVLPEATLTGLHDFAAWARHAPRFATDWGAGQVHGPLALFCGGSGTGKTFAASVVATELGRETGEPWALYSLDLGRIMSKYVGETEANLNALLDSLEGRRAILQIDEADGLLGKRGEVSDARDRYANLEVSHMLSRFERHQGPVVLTTNLRGNIDAAFLRRFQMIVDFPEPDAAARARLWAHLLPPDMARDPALDVTEIATSARLSGGSIENAARYAAILAHAAGAPLGMGHVARAVWAELSKEPRQIRPSEIGALGAHLPGGAP